MVTLNFGRLMSTQGVFRQPQLLLLGEYFPGEAGGCTATDPPYDAIPANRQSDASTPDSKRCPYSRWNVLGDHPQGDSYSHAICRAIEC